MQESQPSKTNLLPPITNESRPWTRWWWMGNAVNKAEITRHLQLFQNAGIGGVEVSPIYGVTGEEDRYIPFLSPQWISMLRYTVGEAGRLGLGVDMITGTGWPLGGPWVSNEDAAAKVAVESYSVAEGEQVTEPIISKREPEAILQALMAYSQDGQILDLREYVDAQQLLHWTAPSGEWQVYAVFQRRTGQQVKRAAPGGEGNVVDHFSSKAIDHYLAYFDKAFTALPADEQVRCFFNDSYEVYEANWTAALFSEFQHRRGYDLHQYLPALCGHDMPDIVSRVRSDYRQTISDLVLDAFVQPWTAWAHRYGAMSRNQAHGSPGNLLDLYAAADIPETETFGPDWLRLAGLSPLPGTPPQQGGIADLLVGKFASSAAHVAGKRLCSSEAFTWLGEHGKVPLAHMKAELDMTFVMGINHVFFHGTPFSPEDAGWPGWMFYATTHVAPSNSFWRDLPALNTYISRCQSFLQTGQPDNDLLLYLPIFDLWANDHGSEHLLHFLTVHSEHWLNENLEVFAAAARQMWDRGFSFDFVSDRLLSHAIQVAEQRIQSRGGTYRALVIAGCTLMPPETLESIAELARAGATVVVVGELPRDVPGLATLAQRRQQLQATISSLGSFQTIQPGVSESHVGQGRFLVGSDLETMLQMAGVQRESIVDTGIELVRRRDEHGYLYFLTNAGQQRVDQWVNLPIDAASVLLVDPSSNRQGVARIRSTGNQDTQIYLQLEPGESILLRTFSQSVEYRQWQYLSPATQPHELAGTWQVDFIEGRPTLPSSATVEHLTSWTEWPTNSEVLQAFSGTARYTITFKKPPVAADAWAIDLGIVCHSAGVKLNGQDVGTVYARPFHIVLPHDLHDENQLEIEVTNLMANRLAALDRQGDSWRKFFFVNIKYEPFDASKWTPLPSGLLGPVKLVPLRQLHDL